MIIKYFPKLPATQLSEIKITPSKMQQILAAGKEQLSPEEFEELSDLLFDLAVYGLTPWINTKLGTLMSRIQWELEIAPSPEWEEALIACDRTFLGRELKEMCIDSGLSSDGHKKLLCARLYRAEVSEVVVIMKPYLKEEAPEEVTQLPQTEHLYVSKLRKIKDGLEKVRRTNPDEFYHREKLIRKAIEEREKGKTKTMPELTLEELRELLRFTGRLYR